MQGIIFTNDSAHGFFLQQVLHSENIPLNLVTRPFSLTQYLGFSGNIIFFDLPVTAEMQDFLKYMENYRPCIVTIYLCDRLPDKTLSTDFVFLKPFHAHSALFQIRKKIFEKQKKFQAERVCVGETGLDLCTREICRSEYRVPLRNKEFSLLQVLMMNPGKVFTRTDLLEFVWDRFSSLTTNTVDVHVSRLRKKLKKCESHLQIRTIPYVGYILENSHGAV